MKGIELGRHIFGRVKSRIFPETVTLTPNEATVLRASAPSPFVTQIDHLAHSNLGEPTDEVAQVVDALHEKGLVYRYEGDARLYELSKKGACVQKLLRKQ